MEKQANVNADLLRACMAVLAAVDSNASQGGDLGVRIDKANPLTVACLREAIAKARA